MVAIVEQRALWSSDNISDKFSTDYWDVANSCQIADQTQTSPSHIVFRIINSNNFNHTTRLLTSKPDTKKDLLLFINKQTTNSCHTASITMRYIRHIHRRLSSPPPSPPQNTAKLQTFCFGEKELALTSSFSFTEMQQSRRVPKISSTWEGGAFL